MPKVTVIIATCNRSNVIIDAIESVLKQDISDFEILVIDDGSTDNTKAVVTGIKDKRLKYIYKANGGLSSAHNTGLVNAKGKYIALLDDDDMFVSDYLKVMTLRLDQNPEFGLAYAQFKDMHTDGSEKMGFKEDRYLSGELTKHFYGKMPCILPSAVVLRNSALNGMFFDENLKDTADIDFFLRFSAKTKFLCVPEVYVNRRVLESSMAAKATRNFSPNAALILERFYFALQGKELVPKGMAKSKISTMYRRIAKHHYRHGNRKAAIEFFKKSIRCYPFANKHIRGLLKALLLPKKDDNMPDWCMPEPLPAEIKVSNKIMQLHQKKPVDTHSDSHYFKLVNRANKKQVAMH